MRLLISSTNQLEQENSKIQLNECNAKNETKKDDKILESHINVSIGIRGLSSQEIMKDD